MTNEIFNSHKINIYCKIGSLLEDIFETEKYTIKDCENKKDNLILSSILFASIYGQCINNTTEETYCLDSDEICATITKIYNLIKNCNC